MTTRRRAIGTALASMALAATLAGCGGSDSNSLGVDGAGDGESKLTLVAYSTPREAYEEIIPAFNETPAGQGVSFDQSYASSGEQSRAVESGLEADVVTFSLEPDMTRLVDAGLVDADWSATSTTAWSPTRSSSSSCARATPRGSRAGTTS